MSGYEIHLAPRTWGAGEGYLDIPVDIKLVKAELDRYAVIAPRFSGQVVGYVWKSPQRQGRARRRTGRPGSRMPRTTRPTPTFSLPAGARQPPWRLARAGAAPQSAAATTGAGDPLPARPRGLRSIEPLVEKARRPFIIAQAEAGKDWAIRHLIDAAKQEV